MEAKQELLQRVARRAQDLLQELERYETPQFDVNDNFGPDTAMGGLSLAIMELQAKFPEALDWTPETFNTPLGPITWEARHPDLEE